MPDTDSNKRKPGGRSNDQLALSVLVYDDKPEYRKLIRSMLGQSDKVRFKIEEASNTREMKSVLKKNGLDVVILDLELRGKSGMDWLEELNEQNIAPVVIITGHGNEQIAVEAMKRGAYDYLPKAYLTYDQLTKALLNARERWNLLIEREQLQQKLAHMAMYDALTDILSRRAIMEQVESERQRTTRYDRPLSILMVDIDHFKNVNDTFGHVAGDVVLREVAQTLYDQIRRSDFVGRYGGEEFLVVLPETSLDKAIVLGEKLRKSVAALSIQIDGEAHTNTTISVGAAEHEKDKSVDAFINRSDHWLYEAKNRGRNQVQPQRGNKL